MSGFAAKCAGKGAAGNEFEIGGLIIAVGSLEHEDLIREAIKQKLLHNPRAFQALEESRGQITHHVPRGGRPLFKMELLLVSLRKELFGY